ncbi:MAG: G/U mismatch-specific DNA glycosylase [Planctomycetes bacterium]|nr:G/U mismatch-specific DNA glycosylase [Planctomycetota bacterium]
MPRRKRSSEAPNRRPTPAEIAAAAGRTIPDAIARGLRVLLVGINPGLYSAAIGHHFGRPGNRFWRTLFESGFTDRLLSPFEDGRLLEYGLGITNVASRATARADELSREELAAGGLALARKIARFRPRAVVFLGVTAYRTAFELPYATIGRQHQHPFGNTTVWVQPNPSGLNAHYQLPELVRLFAELRKEVDLGR